MASSDSDQESVKPSEQRAEPRRMSLRPARRACGRAPRAKALFPANWEAPTYRAKCRRRSGTRQRGSWRDNRSDEPATEDGIDPPGANNADATTDGGPDCRREQSRP